VRVPPVRRHLVSIRHRFGVEAVNARGAARLAGYAGPMTPYSHLASIRELREIRRERPRVSGETEEQYCERLASELRRRQRAGRRHDLVVRVLRREPRR
jgi:hypothetical protein